eukprot:7544506-Pyramimonas_sp.AAC.1
MVLDGITVPDPPTRCTEWGALNTWCLLLLLLYNKCLGNLGDDKRVLILEISYTALGLMSARTEDKRRKYENTLNGLREDGWEPELYTL